jgi:hypothetical protein
LDLFLEDQLLELEGVGHLVFEVISFKILNRSVVEVEEAELVFSLLDPLSHLLIVDVGALIRLIKEAIVALGVISLRLLNSLVGESALLFELSDILPGFESPKEGLELDSGHPELVSLLLLVGLLDVDGGLLMLDILLFSAELELRTGLGTFLAHFFVCTVKYYN